MPEVVPKNCEPELSYILAELFNKCIKESCFLDCWKVSLVVPVFKNVGERSTAKITALLVFFLWLVRSSKNFVNNRVVNDLEKYGPFSDFQYGFRSSRSTADLLKVVSVQGFLTGLGLLQLQHVIHQRLSTEFDMLVFFKTEVLRNFRSDIWPYFSFSQ